MSDGVGSYYSCHTLITLVSKHSFLGLIQSTSKKWLGRHEVILSISYRNEFPTAASQPLPEGLQERHEGDSSVSFFLSPASGTNRYTASDDRNCSYLLIDLSPMNLFNLSKAI